GKGLLVGWLHIRPAYRVAWIIDGQHRLFAYANHPLANKSLISVMAFVGLEASEQARLFVDINAEQRKVKQSLLQELYAELHWDQPEQDVRFQPLLRRQIKFWMAIKNFRFSVVYLKVAKTEGIRHCFRSRGFSLGWKTGGFFSERPKRAR